MPSALPARIDPIRLARAREELDGAIDLGRLPRLHDMVPEQGSEAGVSLSFELEQGVCTVSGRIAGRLRLSCQRCLGPMDWEFDVAVRTRVAWSDEEEAGADDECVRVDENGELHLADLIEDEVLLALPAYARHETAECPVNLDDYTVPEQPGRENPFAVLAGLKRDN